MHEPQSGRVRVDGALGRGVLFYSLLLYGLLIGGVLWWRIVSVVEAGQSSNWPTPQDVRLSLLRGVWLATLLLASSVTMLLAVRNAANRACGARWLGWTLGLGLLFVAFQVIEMRTRVRHNLVPSVSGGGVHDRADLYFLSAVRHRLQSIVSELNTAAITANASEAARERAAPSEQRQERLALVNRLLSSELMWTESRVSQQSPPVLADQRAALISLAQDVFPIRAYADASQQFQDRVRSESTDQLAVAQSEFIEARARIADGSKPLQAKLAEVGELNRQLKQVRDQLKRMPPEEELDDEQKTEPTSEEQVVAPGSGRADLQKQLETLQPLYDIANAELTQLATQVTAAEDTVSRLSTQISSLEGRQQWMAELPAEGLNQHYAWLRLPLAVPGGHRWSIAYFGLTVVHLVHFVVGLLSVFPRLARCERPLALGNLAAYWHVQTIAGCVVLGLFYLT